MRPDLKMVLAAMFFSIALIWGADQTAVFSGPQVGEKLPALNVTLVYGKEAGKAVDYIKLANERPTLLVVINGTNRPAASLTRCLMNFAEMRADALFAGTVYLDGDPTSAEQYLRQATSWWGVGCPVGISKDGPEGPGSYGLNRNVNVTVIVANKGRVTHNFPLIQPSMVDAPKIVKEVVALVGGRVPGHAELDFLAMPTQKPANAPFAIAPTDLKMRALICQALASEDDGQAAAAAQELNTFISSDKERQSILGSTASSLLEGRAREYVAAMPITKYLKSWQDQYATVQRKKAM